MNAYNRLTNRCFFGNILHAYKLIDYKLSKMTKSIFAINEEIKKDSKTVLDNIKVGDTVKIVLKLKETNPDKKSKGSKTQTVQGLVLARKHNKELGAAITIRSIVDSVGVE